MIKQTKMWLLLSVLTCLASLVIIVTIRPVWGIDFVGGSLLEIQAQGAGPEQIRALLADQLDIAATVQALEGDRLLIRTAPLSETQHQEVTQVLRGAEWLSEELRFESIGPTIGAELRRKAIVALGVVLAALIAYLAYIFRETAGLVAGWKFGIAAIYALLHDLLFVTAVFVILGRVLEVTVDTLFVTALLAIVGYSVNDTIVIFNRIKSDWLVAGNGGLLETLDGAVRKSLTRSLNTSFTTLLVLGALILFGGSTIRWFVVALAAGTIAGTYSSLFVAPPLLYYLAKK